MADIQPIPLTDTHLACIEGTEVIVGDSIRAEFVNGIRDIIKFRPT